MQNDLNQIFQLQSDPGDMMIGIFVALICGSMIAFFYKHSYRGPGYPLSYLFSLIILSMITTIVIMVIGNNLARAFGLVGAMSIIRFRTAVKDTLDIMFIFFALAEGMAAGVGFYKAAIQSTIVIGIIAVILSRVFSSVAKKRKFLLQFTFDFTDKEEPPYLKILNNYCKSISLVNTKSHTEVDMLELSYYVDLRDSDKNTEFIRELRQLNGIHHVNMFYDDEEI